MRLAQLCDGIFSISQHSEEPVSGSLRELLARRKVSFDERGEGDFVIGNR